VKYLIIEQPSKKFQLLAGHFLLDEYIKSKKKKKKRCQTRKFIYDSTLNSHTQKKKKKKKHYRMLRESERERESWSKTYKVIFGCQEWLVPGP